MSALEKPIPRPILFAETNELDELLLDILFSSAEKHVLLKEKSLKEAKNVPTQ